MSRSKILFLAQAAVVGALLYTLLGQVLVEYSGSMFDDMAPPSVGNVIPEAVLAVLAAALLLVVLELARRKGGEALPVRLPFVAFSAGGVAVGIGIAILLWGVSGSMALKREIASLESAGLAAKMAERVKPPEGENAVAVLLQAQEALKESLGADYHENEPFRNLQQALDRFVADGTVGAELEAAKPMLVTNGEAIALAVQATGKKAAYWDIDFSPPAARVQFPEHLQHNILVNLLALQAIERAQAGDTAGSASSIRAGLALGDVIGASPLLLSQMFRSGVNTTLLSTARRIFDTPAELAIADASWSAYLDPQRSLDDTKRAYQIDLLAVPREIVGGVSPSASLGFEETPAGRFFGPVFYFSVRKTLRGHRPTLLACAPAAPGAALPRPAPKLLARTGRSAAFLAVARAAIDYAKAPVAAGDAAKGVGNDPFTGAPLKLVLGSSGALVFSVGPDGKDDGGAAFDRDKDTGDIAWWVQYPTASVARTP